MKTSLLIPVFSLLLFSLLSGCEATEYEVAAFEMDSQSLGNMYGKVVDQYSNPVVGAKVRGYVRYFDGGHSYFTETDGQGRFKFLGLHGLDFGVAPTKDGYALYTGHNWSKDYKPDPNNPMVFVMYKLQGAEPTVSGDKFWGINPDGRIFTIDLIKIKKIESASAEGDIRVIIKRPPGIKRSDRFDWTFSMEAIGGGFISTSDLYLNEAPVSGYQSKVEITMLASDPKWTPEFQGTFYIKSRDGKVYGHIQIEVIPAYNDSSVFSIKSLANPSGSRNLEWDEEKEIKP